MEGSLCYEPSSGCQTANRVLPIIQVNHSSGDCAIVGGYRYRGTAIPSLVGKVRAQRQLHGPHPHRHPDRADDLERQAVDQDTPFNIYTFGEDQNGELYASGGGTIYRLVSAIPVASIADRTQAENAGPATFTVTLGLDVHAAGDPAVRDRARHRHAPAPTTRRSPASSPSLPARRRARWRSRS